MIKAKAKNKGLALKVIKEASSDDDEEMSLLVRRFRKFMRTGAKPSGKYLIVPNMLYILALISLPFVSFLCVFASLMGTLIVILGILAFFVLDAEFETFV